MVSVFQAIVGFFSVNAIANQVFAYLALAWLVVTVIRNAGLLIVKATANSADDAWFNKWIVKPLAFIEPFIRVIPHSTFNLSGIFQKIASVFTWVANILPNNNAK